MKKETTKINSTCATNTSEYIISTEKSSTELTQQNKKLYINIISEGSDDNKISILGEVIMSKGANGLVMNIRIDQDEYQKITMTIIDREFNGPSIQEDIVPIHKRDTKYCQSCQKNVSETNWAKHCGTVKHKQMKDKQNDKQSFNPIPIHNDESIHDIINSVLNDMRRNNVHTDYANDIDYHHSDGRLGESLDQLSDDGKINDSHLDSTPTTTPENQPIIQQNKSETKFCQKCNCHVSSANWSRHCNTSKHKNGKETKQVDHKCNQCDYSSKYKYNLSKHKSLHDNTNVDRYYMYHCKACNEYIRDTENRSKHIRTDSHHLNVCEKFPELSITKLTKSRIIQKHKYDMIVRTDKLEENSNPTDDSIDDFSNDDSTVSNSDDYIDDLPIESSDSDYPSGFTSDCSSDEESQPDCTSILENVKFKYRLINKFDKSLIDINFDRATVIYSINNPIYNELTELNLELKDIIEEHNIDY